jgi:chemotaxis protein MotB
MAKKKKKEAGEASGAWIVTYSDMVTLMLCVFVALFNPDEIDPVQLQALISSFSNNSLGNMIGGNTLTTGMGVGVGNTVAALPSQEFGRALATAMRKAVSLFTPEVRSNKVKVTQNERGLVISLASDMFFYPASARINVEETRGILINLAVLLNSEEVGIRKVRIEGHTDAVDVDPAGPWQDNWQLSSERPRAVLRFLTDLGVDEKRFQIAGFGDTVPVSSNDTPEGRAYNRRVDIVIIDEGHL